MLISLDISIRSTGYCIFNDKGELVVFGTINSSSKDLIYTRLDYIESKLISILNKYKITTACVEAPSFGSRGAMSYNLFGVHFSIVRVLNNYNIAYSQLNIASIKKYATGNGRAGKENMVDCLPVEIKELFLNEGFKKTTGLYDLTDAYFIGKKYMKDNEH